MKASIRLPIKRSPSIKLKIKEGGQGGQGSASQKATKGNDPTISSIKKGSPAEQPVVVTKLQQERARHIQDFLDRIYPDPPVPLDHQDAFTFLCAVMMSAQTTDGKVNEVSKELFKRAPSPKAMASLSPEQVLEIIKPLGLAPTKSKNLVAMANMLVRDFCGQVPSTFEQLESLPGVGHKTASVVMSQIFGVSAFPVDTHIARLAVRWGLSSPPKNQSEDSKTSVTIIERDLKSVFAKDSWNKLHLQIIYYGREYCTAKGHEVANCPICSWIKNNTSQKKSSQNEINADLKIFTPTKPAKNIVLYNARIAEINSPDYQSKIGVTSKHFSKRRKIEVF